MAHKFGIMVIPYPAQGHMNPMMQFSKRLAAKGLPVTFLSTTSITDSLPPQTTTSIINLDFISYKSDNPDMLEFHPGNVKQKVSQELPDLIEKHKNAKVLVYDSHMPWAGDIGHRLGLKVVPFFTQAAAASSIYYHVYKGNLKVPPERETVKLPSMPELKINDLPSSLYDGSYPGTIDLHKSQFSNIDKADWILFNTFDELESELMTWMTSQLLANIKTVGPTIPSMYLDKKLPDDKDYGLSLSLFKPDTKACSTWLDAKPTASVVYVSFGSLINFGQDHMHEVAWGLLESNVNFLWVVRDSEKIKLPRNFVADSAEKGLVVSWCPQLEVLAHKAVGSFMTHCGWNSALEALSLGVPMLVMPNSSDQNTNAKYVVDVWKTGIRVNPDDKEIVKRRDIVDCVHNVMQGVKREELRANALRWNKLAIDAMDEGGSSDRNIEDFVSAVLSS